MNRYSIGQHLLAATLGMACAFITIASFAGQSAAPDSRSHALRSVTVGYADLDLSSPAGVARLYQRLRAASDRVCGHTDARNIRANAERKACYASALGNAVASVRNAELEALHAGGIRDAAQDISTAGS